MEQLIEQVKKHPLLYDTTHEDYTRTKLKDQIWKRIAKELNYSSSEAVKEQWRKLRDCHRDALRRQNKKKNGPRGSAVKRWLYQRQMEFLRQYMTIRTSTGNNLEDECAQDNVNDIPGTSKVLEGYTVFEDKGNATPKAEEEEDDDSERHSPFEERSNDERPTKRSKMMVESLPQNNFAFEEQKSKQRECFREQMSEVHKEKETNDHDALYQFFMSMYNSTKNMPKVSQIRVRRKVFEAVSVEEENMFNYEMYSNSPETILANGSSVPCAPANLQISLQ